MPEDIETLAEQLRTSPTEAARAVVRTALATAIRRLSSDRLRILGVPSDVADDEANYLAFELVRRIERQTIQIGCEAAYVKRCAQNRATDYYRHASGVRATCVSADDDVNARRWFEVGYRLPAPPAAPQPPLSSCVRPQGGRAAWVKVF